MLQFPFLAMVPEYCVLQEFHFGFTVLHHHSGCDTYILKVTSCNGALAV
jgi:hypothetical protein